jgi:hypothetical protein
MNDLLTSLIINGLIPSLQTIRANSVRLIPKSVIGPDPQPHPPRSLTANFLSHAPILKSRFPGSFPDKIQCIFLLSSMEDSFIFTLHGRI